MRVHLKASVCVCVFPHLCVCVCVRQKEEACFCTYIDVDQMDSVSHTPPAEQIHVCVPSHHTQLCVCVCVCVCVYIYIYA